jgi:DNA-binding PadR family transcriptional regulator
VTSEIERGSIEHLVLLEIARGEVSSDEELLQALLERGLDVDMERIQDALAHLSEHGYIERDGEAPTTP